MQGAKIQREKNLIPIDENGNSILHNFDAVNDLCKFTVQSKILRVVCEITFGDF